MDSETYQKTSRNSINRLRYQAAYDHDTVHSIVDSCPILHISFNPVSDDPFPTTLPFLGCMGTYDDRPCVYMHGYISARLMRLPSKAEEEAGHPGLPVCVAASHFDGLVMALAPFHNSYNYRSAVLHGWAKLVADEDERLAALERITNNVVADNWSNCRMPPTKAELTTTAVLRVEVETASAKVRIGGPDDDRADLRNEDVVGRFWTGVVPAWVQYGEPVESDHNKVAKVPDYFKTFLQTQNEKNKEVAIKAVEPPPKKK